MISFFGILFSAALGLCFGSFLNVCLSRWPAGESIIHPRSHCRHCNHELSLNENIPLLSFFLLNGRCLKCKTPISLRYPIIEAVMGLLWAAATATFFQQCDLFVHSEGVLFDVYWSFCIGLAGMLFYWMLTALAMLDFEHLWLPDSLTYTGIFLGLAQFVFFAFFRLHFVFEWNIVLAVLARIAAIAAAASVILLIRWLYFRFRHREGMGLGDAKLMAMLAAWLGFSGAMVSLFLAVMVGTLAAIALLLLRDKEPGKWATIQLPMGTFLCAGAILNTLFGDSLGNFYRGWAGF